MNGCGWLYIPRNTNIKKQKKRGVFYLSQHRANEKHETVTNYWWTCEMMDL
jgi:hypothetical protein